MESGPGSGRRTPASIALRYPRRASSKRSAGSKLRDAQDDLIRGEDFAVLLSEIQPPFIKGDFSIESAADGRVVVGFPELTNGDLLKITFKTSVLRFGQTFAGRAWLADPASPEDTPLPQQAVPGNAAQLAPDDVESAPGGQRRFDPSG